MNETPNEPRPPDEGDGGQPTEYPPSSDNPSPDPGPPVGSNDPTQPENLGELPPLADDAEFGELPPLDEDSAGGRRRFGGRMLAAGVAVLLLVGGVGGALALRGGGDDGGDNSGVASVDGSDGSSDNRDNSSGNGSRRPDEGEMQDAALEFAQCMRDHGIDMPDPDFSGDGVAIDIGGPDSGATEEEMQAAQEACQHILDDAAPEMNLSPEEVAEMQDKQVAMAQCMRDKGYDMPDPQVDSSGRVTIGAAPGDGGQQPGAAPGSAENDQFRQDMDDCGEQAGLNGGPGGGEGPRTNTGGGNT
jgi:hypothetical protein